jgi:predicted RNase H-like HicB family nuclease
MSLQVSFRLNFATRHDVDANVYVGYCPALKLYSQGSDNEEAKAAIVSAAKLFIVRCYEKDILHTILRERGMTKASSAELAKLSAVNSPDEYIAVGDFTDHFCQDVPIQLLAAKEAAKLCLQ